MSILFPVVILFSMLQVLGYRYADKKQVAKGRLKTLLAIIFLYILLAVVIPMAPDGEYMTSEVILLIKAGIVLIGTIFSLFDPRHDETYKEVRTETWSKIVTNDQEKE